MKPREVERILKWAGWVQIPHAGKGSHRVYRHPERLGVIVLPWHQSDDLAKGTLNSILKAAGLK